MGILSGGSAGGMSGVFTPELLITLVCALLTRTLARTPRLWERALVGLRAADAPSKQEVVEFVAGAGAAEGGLLVEGNALGRAQKLVDAHTRTVTHSYFPASAFPWDDLLHADTVHGAVMAAATAGSTSLAFAVWEAVSFMRGSPVSLVHAHVVVCACVCVLALANAPHLLEGATGARFTEFLLAIGVAALSFFLSLVVAHLPPAPASSAGAPDVCVSRFVRDLHAPGEGGEDTGVARTAPTLLAWSLPLSFLVASVCAVLVLPWLRMARCHFDATRLSPVALLDSRRPSGVSRALSVVAFAAPFLTCAVLAAPDWLARALGVRLVCNAPRLASDNSILHWCTPSAAAGGLQLTELALWNIRMSLACGFAVVQLLAVRIHLEAFLAGAARRISDHLITAATAGVPNRAHKGRPVLSPAAIETVQRSCMIESARVKLGAGLATLHVVSAPAVVLGLAALGLQSGMGSYLVHTDKTELITALTTSLGPELVSSVLAVLSPDFVRTVTMHMVFCLSATAALTQLVAVAFWETLVVLLSPSASGRMAASGASGAGATR